MEKMSRDPHLGKAIIIGAVLGAAALILMTMFSALFGSHSSSAIWVNSVVAVLTGAVSAGIAYLASRFGAVDEIDDGDDYYPASINELMGGIDPNDDYVYETSENSEESENAYDFEEYAWDGTEENIETYIEPLPAPTAALPVLSLDELAAATVVIEGHVLKTLKSLPPLPASPPTIHHVSVTVDEPVKVEEPEEKPASPRDTLEASDLRDVIGVLGNQGYIDALQYCLTACEAGSQVVALRAKGRVYGLGARGTKNEDGSTSFTRADVQKMLRKARSITSANVSD